MTYFKIDGVDYSNFTNSLSVDTTVNYNAQTNAAGNTVADYINTKRVIDVGIIPLTDDIMANLQSAISKFNVTISFLDPKTKDLTNIDCIIPSNGVNYYTIQANKVMFNAFNIQFIEL